MDVAVLIPVKRFDHAKGRLGTLLSADERVRLARWLAERVVAAAHPRPVFIACDDDEVAAWADSVEASVLWSPGMGLNGAVDAGRATIAGKGFDHLVIAHSDLPFADDLGRLAQPHTISLVPDRTEGGTNVLALPVGSALAASYGANSFRTHLAMAMSDRYRVEVRHDPWLALDVDTPADLRHPALYEKLPRWLQTILAIRP